jgi:hypothetical protein
MVAQLKYQVIEKTSDGLVPHTVDTAARALSLWYALDGEVEAIRNENQQEISLADLRIAAEKEKV